MACSVQNPVVSVVCLRVTMNSLSFCDQPLTVLVDCWFKIEEFPKKMAISLSEFQREIILSQKTDRIRASVLDIWSHSFLFCLLISSSLPLMNSSKVPLGFPPPFGRPSASLEFLHSLFLSACYCPSHNSKRRSLFMRVLSHSNTHYLNRYKVGCGCHDILIQRCITVLFLSNFSLYRTRLWFWWLSYSNHSFNWLVLSTISIPLIR